MLDLMTIGVSAAAKEALAWVRERLTGSKKESRPGLEPYVIASRIQQLLDPDRRLYVLNLRVANRANVPNAIANIELSIDSVRKTGAPPSNVILPHRSSLSVLVADDTTAPLPLPTDIPARSVRTGLALFEVSSALLRNGRVSSHTLTVTDTDGATRDQEILLLQQR